MLVGEENVGKTSLLRALKVQLAGSTKKRKQTISGLGTIGRATTALFAMGANGKRKDGEEETQVTGDTLSTDGIDLTVEPLALSEAAMALSSSKDRVKPKVPLSFSVWDFGGQEVYHTTHSFFLTERSIYLVVFRADRDERESRVAYWLGAIRSHAPNAPIIIVATHLDKYVDPKLGKKIKTSAVEEALTVPIMEKYKSKYPKLDRNVRAVSTQTYKGIDDLIRHIHDVAIKQPYAQEAPPERWFDLEGIFVDTRRRHNADGVVPILSWEDTANVSKIAQFPTNDNQAELIKAVDYLHETGIIFRHLYTDERTGFTKRTIILDPQWAARVFSTVITTKHGFLRTGVLDEQKLYEQLWREYPAPTHTVLMDLFSQFDLFYKILDDKGKPTGEIMVPATLPTNKPSDVQSILPGKETSLYQFERRYAFEFMPAGLFSRFLVRTMNLAEPLRYWRHGVLLHQQATLTHALIELKPQSNVLTIIVRSGTDASQFFCKLTELFEFLVHHFFKAEFTAQYMDPITSTHFSLEQIEEASAKGETSILTKDGTSISIDRIAPDLALTTFAALQIDIEKEVKLLPEPLGEGAFAIVYKGEYKDDQVAVKRLLRCSTEEQQKRLFSEFRREVLTMSQLAHPNIVNLKGFSNQPPFSMVMELVPHGTLYDFLRRPDPIPWNMRIRIAYDIASAMHFLHSADPPLIHKDLKSPNILMAGLKYDDLVVAKVADFGISGKLYSSKFKAISAKEREVENPTWLAPEVVKTQPYTAAADVYPYGVMLWELVARTHPFDEYHCDFPTDLEEVIVSGKRPTIPKDCPRAFEALIQDCWHDNPAMRPTFAQILARFPSIISEVAPALPGLLARIRRDLADFNKKQDVVKKARDLERQEKWKKMREEESAREAERRRLMQASLSSSPMNLHEEDSSTSMDDSMDASEGKDSTKLASSTASASGGGMSEDIKHSPTSAINPLQKTDKSQSTEDVPSIRRSPAVRTNSVKHDIGTVYHRLSEAELKDLWIQRGIPLQEGATRDRLAEVLENDDQWLFNQRRVLFMSSFVTSGTQSLRASATGGARATLGSFNAISGSVPHQVTLPCLYVLSPHVLTSEIQERNDLLAKQEKALGDFLKKQEAERLELHSKHQRAIATRLEKAAKDNSSTAPSSLSSSSGSVSSSGSSLASSGPKSEKAPSSIQALLSAFNQPTPSPSGSTSPAPSASPAPTASNIKMTTVKATGTVSAPKVAASSPLVRTVPPRPAGSEGSSLSGSGSVPKDDKPLTEKPAAPSRSSSSSPGPVAAPSVVASTSKSTANGASSAPIVATKIANGEYSINGSWSVAERTAGASPNGAHWRRNPQFVVAVGPGGGTVKITLAQKVVDPLPFIAFYIFKSQENRRAMDLKEKIYAPDHFVNKETVEATCNFPEGTFSIMCATFQPETTTFTLSVAGSCVQSLVPVSDYHKSEVTGAWVKPLAGGCMNHPTWRSNPKYFIKVTDTTAKTKLIAVLVAQSEIGAGFYIFAASNPNVPVAKSGFTTISVCHEFSLAAGDYTLVPATYEFGKETSFEIALHSDKPVEFGTMS